MPRDPFRWRLPPSYCGSWPPLLKRLMRAPAMSLANADNWLLDALQYAHIIGDGGAAHIVNPAEPHIRQLHAACRAAELHRGERVHRHAGGPDRMAFGLQAAGRIDRKRAVLLRQSVADRARAFSLRHEAHRFIFDEFRDREAIVGFDEREVGELDAGAPKRARPCLAAALEFQNVAFRHRQEILYMAQGPKDHGLVHGERG